MNHILKIVVVSFMFVTINYTGLAQGREDSLFVVKVSQKATGNLLDLQKTDGPLYNGEMHYSHPKFKNGGHAFFILDSFTGGTIVYDGFRYENMRVMYDLVRGQLLLLNRDSSGSIVVQPEHVDFFSLHHHNFIHIKAGTASKNMASGYYDLLYNGGIALLAKRVKKVTENVTQYVEKEVEETVNYYLLKDSVYSRIKSKQDLLRLFSATQNENQRYIKTNNLDFSRNREESFLKLVSFHDSLNK